MDHTHSQRLRRRGSTRVALVASVSLAAGVLATLILAMAASAQEGPSLTVEPAVVDAAGDHELTVTGTGWTKPVIGVFPCAAPESGQLEDVQPSTCIIALANEVEPVDGAFEFTMTYPVDENGLAIVASNPPPDEGSEAAGTIITVSTDQPEQQAEALANTGTSSAVLALVAAGLILAGGTVALMARRLARA